MATCVGGRLAISLPGSFLIEGVFNIPGVGLLAPFVNRFEATQ
jgi:ABC-type dipeptide/oligopeptide/nickel transport system permease component